MITVGSKVRVKDGVHPRGRLSGLECIVVEIHRASGNPQVKIYRVRPVVPYNPQEYYCLYDYYVEEILPSVSPDSEYQPCTRCSTTLTKAATKMCCGCAQDLGLIVKLW